MLAQDQRNGKDHVRLAQGQRQSQGHSNLGGVEQAAHKRVH